LRHALPLLAALLLTACSPGGGGGDAAKPGEDPKFAGLDAQILQWRGEIDKTDPTCKAGGCADYEVACKAERTMTAEDTAKGATAKVIAAMTFNAKADPNARPGSAFAEFTKSPSGWARAAAKPVNLSSCADF
jgi:hypothetical protein